MRCIEISNIIAKFRRRQTINRNMRCIEMFNEQMDKTVMED